MSNPKSLRSSQLGVNYLDYVPKELEALYISGEHEWLQNAASVYGDDAPEIWTEDILPRLCSGKLWSEDVEDLKSFTPSFLKHLKKLELKDITDRVLSDAITILLGKL